MMNDEWKTRRLGLGAKALLGLLVFIIHHSSLIISNCSAHPVPRGDYDRNLTVTWRTDGVHILYRLEIDQFTLLTTVADPKNGFPLDPVKRVGRDDVANAYK